MPVSSRDGSAAEVARRWEHNQEHLLCLGRPASTRFGATWILTPEMPGHRFNHISQVDVPPASAAALIEAGLAFYPFHGVQTTCVVVSPATRPAELPVLLAHNGFTAAPVTVMVHRRWVGGRADQEVLVQQAGVAERDVFLQLLADCFFNDATRPTLATLRRWWSAAGTLGVRNFLACYGGAPAGIGTLYCRGDVAGIYNMATLPDFRRRGLARAVLTRLLDEAAGLGCDLVGLTPTDMGESLYTSMGFEAAYQEMHYVYRHP